VECAVALRAGDITMALTRYIVTGASPALPRPPVCRALPLRPEAGEEEAFRHASPRLLKSREVRMMVSPR